MADRKEFRLPDVGEGLTEAEIVSWKVRPGDVVKVNDVIVEIETAKSLVELPSPYAGVVADLLVEQGRTVQVGTPLIAIDAGAADGSSGPAPTPVVEAVGEPRGEDLVPPIPVPAGEATVEAGLTGGPAPGGRTSVLVGYGPRQADTRRRLRKGAGKGGAVPAAKSAASAQQAVHGAFAPAPAPAPVVPGERVLAKPPVRRLAKDLGIDLAGVIPRGAAGVVTRADVETAAGVPAAVPAPSYAGPGAGERETRVPIRGVRKMTAEAMVASAFTAPHVTEWITVDVTRTMRLVDRLRDDRDFRDVRLSPLALVAKALLLAVRRHPEINASWDEAAGQIVVKHYVNLGIAAATPRGLVVPNVKNADRLSLRELASALAALTETAREGRTTPADMRGGTITITNVGIFGVDAGTPILNPGEAAILALGAVRGRPWVHKGRVRARQVAQLALSFDHRLVDGGLGSRVLSDVAAVLGDPSQGLVWG